MNRWISAMAVCLALALGTAPAEAGVLQQGKGKGKSTAAKKKKTTYKKPAAKPKPKPNAAPAGVTYINYTKLSGRKPKPGEYGRMHVLMTTDGGTVLSSTYLMGRPALIPITPPKYKDDLQENVQKMSVGDSADIWVVVDSLADGKPLAPGLKNGDKVKVTIKLLEILSKQELDAEKEAYKKQQRALYAQLKADTLAILEYLQKNNLKARRTESGLYYIIDKEGEGEEPEEGDAVSVHYTGSLLDGKVFDSSRERGQPITFNLGSGQVIRGWDEGIALLKQGSRARLLIPSGLGYGMRGATGAIPPNSVLLFDVELVNVQPSDSPDGE